MTPYERLMAEAIPTRPTPPPSPCPPRPWTAEEQAQHWNELGEAITDWHWADDTRVGRRRAHLQLVRRAEAA